MNLIRIWDRDGKEIDLSKYGLTGMRLVIPSPSYEAIKETIPGSSGSVDLGRDLQPRPITAEFLVNAVDYDDSLLLRDELYSLFSKGSNFFIGEIKQPGKRWYVECTESWSPNRISPMTSTISINLSSEKGLSESIGTTQDQFTFDSEVWQVGQGLITDDLLYTHSANVFNIYNAGEEINPRNMDLVIEYKGASNNLTIKNETTGEEWKYNGTSNSGDTIRLEGVRSTKNALSIFRDTNKKLLSLAPGWNGFRLSGTSGSFQISFKFRFYYL